MRLWVDGAAWSPVFWWAIPPRTIVERRALIAQLTHLEAFDAASAADLSRIGENRMLVLDRLVECGVVRRDEGGRCWLKRRHQIRIETLARWGPLLYFVAVLLACMVFGMFYR